MLVEESPILYAICVNSGEYPIPINIGTNIGAIIAHFADAEPINKLMNAVTAINANSNGIPLIPVASKKLAPLTAITVPNLV